MLTDEEVSAVRELSQPYIFSMEDATKVVAEVAELFGVTVEQIKSPSRRADLVDARTAIVVALLSRGLGTTFIAKAIGRDHSSIYLYRDRARGLSALREIVRSI